MTPELQRKLSDLHDAGYLIQIDSGIYVDGPVQAIYPNDLDDGHWLYNSDVYSERPLRFIREHQVSVYKPVENWQTTPATAGSEDE